MPHSMIPKVIFGAALAESFTESAAYHHRFQIRPNLSEKIRHHLEFADSHAQTNIVGTFSLPRKSESLSPAPADDLEWLAFSALAAISGNIKSYWASLIPIFDQIRARTGTKIALQNLRDGNVEFSGYDNPQYFDDISLIRAVGIALVNHESRELFEQNVVIDCQITHALDGVWAAQAMGMLVWQLLAGSDRNTAIENCILTVPTNSWLRRDLNRAMAAAAQTKNVFERVMNLEDAIVDRVSSHPNSAVETLSILLAHARFASNLDEFLLSGYLHPRLNDSLPALHGSVAALLFDPSWNPESSLKPDQTLTGSCLPQLAGLSLRTLVAQIDKGYSG